MIVISTRRFFCRPTGSSLPSAFGFVEVEQYVGREVDTHHIADLFHLQILHSAADIDHGKKQIDDLRRLKVSALPAFLARDQSRDEYE